MTLIKKIFSGNLHRILTSTLLFVALIFLYINATGELSVTNTDISRTIEHVDQWLSASYLRGV